MWERVSGIAKTTPILYRNYLPIKINKLIKKIKTNKKYTISISTTKELNLLLKET